MMLTIEDDVARLREYVETVAKSGENQLPPEPKLSIELGVSRGRLRTMLKHLEDEGLIWRHVGKGTFVGQRELTPEDTSWWSSVSVDNVFDARMLIEPQLAAQAALHATPADLAVMDQCLAEMATVSSFGRWKQLDEKLHRAIACATHNMLLLMLYDTLRAQMRLALDSRLEEIYGAASGPRQGTDREHREFVDAVRSHNPSRAERSMREHLYSVRTQLFGMR